MTRILGIDPGSRITGYGIIETQGNRTSYVASGCVRVDGETLAERVKVVFDGINELVSTHQPEEVAVEQVFVHRNAASALKLGHARGAALVGAAIHALPVFEYTPAQIKLAVTGNGNAAKEQVQHMIRMLLGLAACPQADAADALAVALCHANTHATLSRLPGVQGRRRGRAR